MQLSSDIVPLYVNLCISKDSAPKLSAEEEELIAKFRENQSKAARLPMGVEVRTLIDQSLCYGTLSTNSVQYPNYPTGSIVGFELDDEGKPFFVFSTMSAHTKDVLKDEKASLTITAKDFKGAAEGRVTLLDPDISTRISCHLLR